MSNDSRCKSRSEDGRQCHGDEAHYPKTTHWAAASRVWSDTETLVRPPPTTLERVRALADQWNDTPDYAPSAYDQGRVDQRHDMTQQLLEALDYPAAWTAATLTDFLLARIAEDEEIARYATASPWRYDPMKMNSIDHEESVFAGPDGPMAICVASTGPESGQSMIDARHIATHDPERVLAECEAKRRVVAAFEEERARRDIYNRDYDSGEYDFNENDLHARLASNAECRGLEIAMLALALPYADHPDFNPDWRP